MQNQPLENAEIKVSNIELKEIKKKDGGSFKQYNVSVANPEKGVYYSLPIKKKDGEFTAAYKVYHAAKAKLEDAFINNQLADMKIGYSERAAVKEINGEQYHSKYRTIRFLEITGLSVAEPIAEGDVPIPEEEIPF